VSSKNALLHAERWPLVALALALTLLGVAAADAARRANEAAATDHAGTQAALGRLLGSADLALSSSSRWLRHPSLVEPGAAAADAPGSLDADPAGALHPPRPAILGQSARDLRRIPRGARHEGAP
jgi:hypothetical protein